MSLLRSLWSFANTEEVVSRNDSNDDVLLIEDIFYLLKIPATKSKLDITILDKYS